MRERVVRRCVNGLTQGWYGNSVHLRHLRYLFQLSRRNRSSVHFFYHSSKNCPEIEEVKVVLRIKIREESRMKDLHIGDFVF